MWGFPLVAAALLAEVNLVAPADTLVVCPPQLAPAMRPWMTYREKQGRSIKRIDPPATSAALQQAIAAMKQAEPQLKWVVLVGDAGEGPKATPTHIVDAKVNIHFGSEKDIATDNPSADINQDGAPDLAIGRLPADTPADLQQMIQKIIHYESNPPSVSQRQLNFVAGVGGFGFVDNIIEMVTKRFLTDGIPADFYTTMTYGSWKSSYCPSPPAFHAATLERLNEGCLFWVYMGHGHRYTLDRVNVPGARHHILDIRDMNKLKTRGTPPIAVMLACYTGAFDSERDCLAEEMIRAKGGPVAAFAGSRVTMPYAMAVMGNGLLEQYFVKRRETLGELVMHAKRSLAVESAAGGDDSALAKNRQLLDMLANAVSPKPDLVKDERLEHLALFNLLGDPLLKIPQPAKVSLQADAEIRAGQTLKVQGQCDAGTLQIELVCQRDRQKHSPPNRGTYVESTLAMREFDRTYVLANDRQWAAQRFAHTGGDFQTELTVPDDCRGPCFVRAFLTTEQQHATGAKPVFVKPAAK